MLGYEMYLSEWFPCILASFWRVYSCLSSLFALLHHGIITSSALHYKFLCVSLFSLINVNGNPCFFPYLYFSYTFFPSRELLFPMHCSSYKWYSALMRMQLMINIYAFWWVKATLMRNGSKRLVGPLMNT